jgi:hypothetical protein
MPRGIERISFGDMVLYEHQLDTANGTAKCQEAEDDSEDANCPVKGGISSFSLHCGKMKTKQITSGGRSERQHPWCGFLFSWHSVIV